MQPDTSMNAPARALRNTVRDRLDRVPGLGRTLRRIRRYRDRAVNARGRVANVAMLHAGRCGSSVLADLLNQHPGFRWGGELFEAMSPYYYRLDSACRAEERIADAMYRGRWRYFGFDSKYLPEQHLHSDLANKTPAGYVELLGHLGFTHYILLDRRNHLKRAVSVAIGTRTQLWNTAGQVGAKVTVRMDPERFVSYGREMTLNQYFGSLEERYSMFRGLLEGKRLLELAYEDDVEVDPKIGYDKICAFMGLEPARVQVRLKRMNPYRLPDLVENFDELERFLAGSRHAWMLRA